MPSPAPTTGPLPPRFPFTAGPTPLEPADRLGAALGIAPGCLWVKRDDLTGLALGGNKARKLEFLCADALARGADVLVVGGGAQSNAVRATAAAAARAGLGAHAVLGGPRPERASGNVLLDRLLGCELEWLAAYGFAALEGAIEAACARLSAAGRRPYRVPIGASTPLGALGYVVAGGELATEAPDARWIVAAAGSGGTLAGLAVACAAWRAERGHAPRVLGVDVGARPAVAEAIATLAAETARLARAPAPEPVEVLTGEVGAAYGAPTDASRECLALAARLEGLVLDPVYTAKALAGLRSAVRTGRIARDERIVFVHTGGAPALFDGRFDPP